MLKAKMLAWAAALVPAAAIAQAYDLPPIPVGPSLTRDELCMERHDRLWARVTSLDREREALEREGDAVAARTADLNEESRFLDGSSARSVIDYNERSDDHNRRVQDYNRRVAELNTAASLYNGDLDAASADCGIAIVRDLPRIEYRLR